MDARWSLHQHLTWITLLAASKNGGSHCPNHEIPMDHIPTADSTYASEEITANWSDEVLEGVDFSRCKFSNCTFERTTFNRCTFQSCEFESSDLSLANVTGSSYSSVIFRNCKLRGINWYQTGFAFNATFLDSLLDYSSFFGMKLNKTRFSGTRMREVVFTDASVREAKFDGCNLAGAVFNHTDLERAIFTGAQNYVIDVTQNKVKGAVFELPEAMSLLSCLGIEIR